MSEDGDALWGEPCHQCGQSLGTGPDDEPDAGVNGLPICGECVRNHDEAADFEAMDMHDGELDGVIDWKSFPASTRRSARSAL